MSGSKSLPARPSLESLRKQAKQLARDTAAGDAGAIARAKVHLPSAHLPLTQRNAQLVVAREYGYAGWQELTAEVSKRVANGVEWAIPQARRAIHNNEVERLKELLAEYPALLSWPGEEDDDYAGGLLGFATGAYGDAGDPQREQWFTRAAPAELLIDAGAVVMPTVTEGILHSRAKGLLQLFQRKGLLPRTLKFLAALGDIAAVRAALEKNENDLAAVNEAFIVALSFGHEDVASLILERAIALDPPLGKHVDGSIGRPDFIKSLIENRSQYLSQHAPPWQVFLIQQVRRAIADGNLATFVDLLQREPWLLGDGFVEIQQDLIAQATLQHRGEFVAALLERNPAILRRQPPPESQAIEIAIVYANAGVIPLLTRIWPMPDDLPHAAGMGDLARVKRWFDQSGAPALGGLEHHYPFANDPRARDHKDWHARGAQQILDVALAYAVINRHFDVADFLLAHGANINTDWNSHEPASILHHLVFEDNYESMKFLIDRGIDMTMKDYRWNANAEGWARYGKSDEKMAQWLAEEERQRAAKI
jgi:hypothetical protein